MFPVLDDGSIFTRGESWWSRLKTITKKKKSKKVKWVSKENESENHSVMPNSL